MPEQVRPRLGRDGHVLHVAESADLHQRHGYDAPCAGDRRAEQLADLRPRVRLRHDGLAHQRRVRPQVPQPLHVAPVADAALAHDHHALRRLGREISRDSQVCLERAQGRGC